MTGINSEIAGKRYRTGRPERSLHARILPIQIFRHLLVEGFLNTRRYLLEAFNHAFAAHSGNPRQEEAAHRIAWAAVKRLKRPGHLRFWARRVVGEGGLQRGSEGSGESENLAGRARTAERKENPPDSDEGMGSAVTFFTGFSFARQRRCSVTAA